MTIAVTQKKLWQALRHVLNKGREMTLPPNQSDESMANQFAFFFTQQIKRIQNMFSMSTTMVAPPTDLPPNLSHFSEVSENEILKIIKNSSTKSCLLDPVPNFLFKDCEDNLLPLLLLQNLSICL